MFSNIFQKSLMGNWNRKMEPGNDSFGRVSGYPGPLLFSIINDFDKSSKVFYFILFADDSNLFSSHSNLEILVELVHTKLIHVQCTCFKSNKLSLYKKLISCLVILYVTFSKHFIDSNVVTQNQAYQIPWFIYRWQVILEITCRPYMYL